MSKLRKRTKMAYGLGQVAEGIKSRGFDNIVFFYFVQVLGLSGSLAGTALTIALVFDAVTDPVAGHLSDNWKSRLGRRHPFMYAAALPLGLFWYMLFFPPSGMGQTGLFLWFLTFAVLVRGSMTLYHVPHMALGAELSDDYAERTSVVQYRTFAGMLGGLGAIALGIKLFLPETPDYPENGMLNPAGYPHFALFSALVMFFTIWYSAFGTRSRIPYLPPPPADPHPFSLRATFDEFKLAWANHSFRSLFVGFSLYAVSISISTLLGTHLNVFFWGFKSEQIATLVLPIGLGFIVGVVISGWLHKRFDKKPSLLVACISSGVIGPTAVVLRLLDVLPANGEASLFWIVFAALFALGVPAGVGYTSAGSMMADVAQDLYVKTGRSQQGILFAAVAFSSKVGSAGGIFLAGVGIDLINFPLQADLTLVPANLILRLGLLSLVSAPLAFMGVWAYTFYKIDRDSYEASMQSLAEGGLEATPPGPVSSTARAGAS